MGADWRPAASLETLRLRAGILARIRSFFATRQVMEVETPVLGAASVTDPYIASLHVAGALPGDGSPLWLQTSPEYAMKRLLAAGSGPIYQLTRAFRSAELGTWHNPEFTMLEWYRPEFDHHDLMQEVYDLVRGILGSRGKASVIPYREVFQSILGLDPFQTDVSHLRDQCLISGLDQGAMNGLDRDALLDFLFSQRIQPRLGYREIVFVTDYPPSQAALARISESEFPVAERFEMFIEGVELANGYHELTDPAEQRLRFEADRRKRERLGLAPMSPDPRLLEALQSGLPDCAGVALGLDRLVALAAGLDGIHDAIAFPQDRA